MCNNKIFFKPDKKINKNQTTAITEHHNNQNPIKNHKIPRMAVIFGRSGQK